MGLMNLCKNTSKYKCTVILYKVNLAIIWIKLAVEGYACQILVP